MLISNVIRPEIKSFMSDRYEKGVGVLPAFFLFQNILFYLSLKVSKYLVNYLYCFFLFLFS